MPQTGFIDHIGIGVPDLAAAKEYYDELLSVLGLREWFETTLNRQGNDIGMSYRSAAAAG